MALYKYKTKEIEIKQLKTDDNEINANVNGLEVKINFLDNFPLFVEENKEFHPLYAVKDEKNNIHIQYKGKTYKLDHQNKEGITTGEEVASGKIEPPMPGKILELKVKKGDKVEKNQTLLLMESMKLQVEIKAPFDGIVKTVNCSVDQMVNGGEMIVEIEEQE